MNRLTKALTEALAGTGALWGVDVETEDGRQTTWRRVGIALSAGHGSSTRWWVADDGDMENKVRVIMGEKPEGHAVRMWRDEVDDLALETALSVDDAAALIRGTGRTVVGLRVLVDGSRSHHEAVLAARDDDVYLSWVCRASCTAHALSESPPPPSRVRGLREVTPASLVASLRTIAATKVEATTEGRRPTMVSTSPRTDPPATVTSRANVDDDRTEKCRACRDTAAVAGAAGWCESCLERRRIPGNAGLAYRLEVVSSQSQIDPGTHADLLGLLQAPDTPSEPSFIARRRLECSLRALEARFLPRTPVMPSAAVDAWIAQQLPANRRVASELARTALAPRALNSPPVAVVLASEPGRGKSHLATSFQTMMAAAGPTPPDMGHGPGYACLTAGPGSNKIDGADPTWRASGPGLLISAMADGNGHVVAIIDDAPRHTAEGSWEDALGWAVSALDSSCQLADRHLRGVLVPTRNVVWILTANLTGQGSMESLAVTHPHIVDRTTVLRLVDSLGEEDADFAVRRYFGDTGLGIAADAHRALLQFADATRGPSLRPLERTTERALARAREDGAGEVTLDHVREAVLGVERITARSVTADAGEAGEAVVIFPVGDHRLATVRAVVCEVPAAAAAPLPPRVFAAATRLGLGIPPVVWDVEIPDDGVPDAVGYTALLLALLSMDHTLPWTAFYGAIDVKGRITTAAPLSFSQAAELISRYEGHVIAAPADLTRDLARWDLLLETPHVVEVNDTADLRNALGLADAVEDSTSDTYGYL